MANNNMEAIYRGIKAAVGFAALYMINPALKPAGMGCLCPPAGAVAVLLFCAPKAGASQPKAILGSHVIAGLVGYCVVSVGIPFSEAVAVVATIILMSLFGMVHPPAAAYAYLYAMKKMGPKGIVAPGLIGATILIGVQKILNGIIPKKAIEAKKDK
eukprot:263026_1